MNNKRGSVGGRILLVLILMLLAAGGGAYGYRVMDGKMAVRDAQKLVKNVEVSDYDTAEATTVQGYIDKAIKDLETATTRKEVYEIIDDFKEDVAKVQTKAQKELEAARKEAEDARNANLNNNNNNSGNYNNQTDGSGNNDSTANGNGSDSTGGNSGSGGYKSNNLTNAEDGTEDSGSLLGNLFGSNDD